MSPAAHFPNVSIKVEPKSPPKDTDEENNYHELLLQETKYQPAAQLPVSNAVILKEATSCMNLARIPDVSIAPESTARSESEIPEAQLTSVIGIKKFVVEMLKKLEGARAGLPESRKREWDEAFSDKNCDKLSENTFINDVPNSVPAPPMRPPPKIKKILPVPDPRLPARVSAVVQTVVPDGRTNPKIDGKDVSVEPQKKKVKLSGVPVRNGPVLTVTPFNVNDAKPRTGLLHFFECPTCCQQFSSKVSTQQHFRTCKKAFNAKANSGKFL